MKDEKSPQKVADNRAGQNANSVSLLGASLFEYIVVVVCLGFAIYGTLIYFKPNAESFHNEMKQGMSTSYPENFVGPLTPAPTAVPTVASDDGGQDDGGE